MEKKPSRSLSTMTNRHYFHTDNIFDILYFPFCLDFGPPSTGTTYVFCKTLEIKLEKWKKEICFYSKTDDRKNTTNAVFLIGAFCILMEGWDAERTINHFKPIEDYLEFYRDAADGPSTYDLGMDTCFRALEKAKKLGWINFDTFDYDEYSYYEQVENGDFNWIIPNKFLAFASPSSPPLNTGDIITHSPEYYAKYFKSHGITTIIRLNKVLYNAEDFTKKGFEHFDMYFTDGTVPPYHIVENFLRVAENSTGGIAVHCKQGLGRTGTLLACYIMKHYDFTAAESVAFIRLQRPGSVVGPQQNFCHKMQPLMKSSKKLNLSSMVTPKRKPVLIPAKKVCTKRQKVTP